MSARVIPFRETFNAPFELPRPSSAVLSTTTIDDTEMPHLLRYKLSYRTILGNKDSSETAPSLRSSIYEARKWLSTEENIQPKDMLNPKVADESRHGFRFDQKIKDTGSWHQSMNIPIRSQSMHSPWIYGKPLETIKEQNSHTTLRPTRSFEDENRHLQYEDTATARKKKSFSFSDLSEAGTLNKRIAPRQTPDSVFDIIVYAEPKKPSHDPPERAVTPPGLPSWTASQIAYNMAQNSTSANPRPPWQRRVRLRFQSSLHSPRSRARKNTNNRRVPRFRPPQSGHGTNNGLQAHPFNQQITLLKESSTDVPIVQTEQGRSHALRIPAAEYFAHSLHPRVHSRNTVHVDDNTTIQLATPTIPTSPCKHKSRKSRVENVPLLSLRLTPTTSQGQPPSADTQAFLDHLDSSHVQGGYCWSCLWDRAKETFCLFCCGYEDDHDCHSNTLALQPGVADFAARFAGARRIDRGGTYSAGI